jgi:hypothetical protein
VPQADQVARAVQVAPAVPAEPEGGQVALAEARVAPAAARAVLEVARVVPAGTNDPVLGVRGIKN